VVEVAFNELMDGGGFLVLFGSILQDSAWETPFVDTKDMHHV
jgi:hypothetical protein